MGLTDKGDGTDCQQRPLTQAISVPDIMSIPKFKYTHIITFLEESEIVSKGENQMDLSLHKNVAPSP